MPPRPPAPAPARSRAGLVVLLLAGTAIAATAATSQVWTKLRAIHYGYRISEATRQQVALIEANRRLRLEVALLTSPQRIAREVAELNLQPPTPEQIRRLRWVDGPKLRPRRPASINAAVPSPSPSPSPASSQPTPLARTAP